MNKHGLKIKGIKQISSDSKNLQGYQDGAYLQVNYDTSTGAAWSDYHCSLGQNTWCDYHDANIITVGNISSPKSMQDIANMIAFAVADRT